MELLNLNLLISPKVMLATSFPRLNLIAFIIEVDLTFLVFETVFDKERELCPDSNRHICFVDSNFNGFLTDLLLGCMAGTSYQLLFMEKQLRSDSR